MPHEASKSGATTVLPAGHTIWLATSVTLSASMAPNARL
jgi:hypothetical protein